MDIKKKVETSEEMAHSLPINIPRSLAGTSSPISIRSHPQSADLHAGSVASVRSEVDRSEVDELSDSLITLPDSITMHGEGIKTPTSILSPSPKHKSVSQVESLKSDASMNSSLAGSKSSVGSPKNVTMSDTLESHSSSKSFSQAKSRAQEQRKKKDRSDTERSTFTLIFGSFNRQISMRSVGSGSGSKQRINIVTEAQSIVPSLTSAFSIENLPQPSERWLDQNILNTNLIPNAPLALSHHDHLEFTEGDEIFERTDYLETIQSTDSAGSLLKRSVSVPPQYEYRSRAKPTAREIFQDFLPPNKDGSSVELSERKQFSRVMEDLIEQPEYENTVQSSSSQAGLLARTALSIIKGNYGTKTGTVTEEDEEDLFIDPRRYIKNLIVLSISFMLIFISYMSLRNLQSSLYNEGGLGLYSLSSVYASLFVGCIFATTIVQRLRPKPTMLLAGFGFLLYCIANFYPRHYTLIPASCVAGFSLAIMWTSHATYLTNIAARYAEMKGKSMTNTLGNFNGIFYLFFQTSQIWGGIISSTVLPSPSELPPFDNTTLIDLNYTFTNSVPYYHVLNDSHIGQQPNTSHCGSAFCHTNDMKKESADVEKQVLYTLISIYTACCLIGTLLLFLMLDPLEGVMKKSTATLGKQLTAVFKHFVDRRVVCLLGLMFYSLLQNSFFFGEFTKAYVTCPVGVYMVGYTMLCVSAASAFSSYVNGKLLKYVGRLALFAFAAIIQLALLITMLLWTPLPRDIPVVFTIAGLWGIADGIFITQTISLFGILFTKKKEPAFAGLKMCQALAAFMLFMTSQYMCMLVKILVVGGFLVVAMTGLIVLEVTMKVQEKKQKTPKPCGNPEPVSV